MFHVLHHRIYHRKKKVHFQFLGPTGSLAFILLVIGKQVTILLHFKFKEFQDLLRGCREGEEIIEQVEHSHEQIHGTWYQAHEPNRHGVHR